MRGKVWLGFLALIVLLWAICLYALWSSMSVREVFVELGHHVVPSTITMIDMRTELNEVREETLAYILRGNVISEGKTSRERLEELYRELKAFAVEHLEHEIVVGPKAREDAEELANLSEKLILASTEITELKDRGAGADELVETMDKGFYPVFVPLRERLGELMGEHQEELSAVEARVHDKHDRNIKFIPIVGILATLIALVVAFFVDRFFARYRREQRRAEEGLRSSEERLKALFESAPDAYFLNNAKGKFINCNRAAEELTGHKKEELIGKNFLELRLLPPEQIPKAVEGLAKTVEDRPAELSQYTLNRKDGSQVQVEIRANSIKMGGQTLTLGLVRDITERKRMEETLRESEEKYRLLVENANEAILVAQDGKHKFVNSKMVEMTGYSEEELLSAPFLGFVHPDDRKMVIERYQRRLEGEELPHVYPFRIVDKSGNIKWVQINAAKFNWNGRPATLSLLMDITERKRMEEAIKQSAEEWQMTFDATADLVFFQDKDLRFVRVNKAAAEALKARPEDVIGKTCYEVLHKRDKPWVNCPMVKAFKDGKTHTQEIDDAIIGTTLLVSASPMFDEKGKLIGGVHVAKDITQRKKIEEELQKRTHDLGERVKELNCLYGIYELVEKEGIFLEEILEGTLNLIPRSWQYPEITCARIVLEGQEFKTNNFRETAWRQTSDIAVHGKKIGTVEVFYLEEKPMSDEGPFLKEERSLVDAIAEQLARIIERKRIENELRIKEEAIASSVNAITLADLRGNLTYVNRAFLHMWGYSDDKEVFGKPIARFLHTQDKAAELMEALRNKKSWMGELAAKRKDGSTFDVHLLANIVENEAGRAICMMASVIDITERKRIEQMKDDFVSLASHELRTPLTSIVGYVDLILGEDVGKINKEQKEFLEIISQNTQRLEALVNDVLDIEKIESGRIKLKREKVNLIELVEASVNTFKVMAENKNLKLEKEIKAPELEVLGDSNRLSQVLSNLLSNAIKYTKEGRVKVAAQAKGRFASVTVEDTGLGMRQEDLRNIFSRFFRSEDSYVKKTTGSGLGLSIAKATIERHNGNMKVESKLGVGSRFEVILPLLKKTEKV